MFLGKGRRAGIPRRLGMRAATVLGVVHLDLTGPHPRPWEARPTYWLVQTANPDSLRCRPIVQGRYACEGEALHRWRKRTRFAALLQYG